jgi:SpoVK/Ycf46/Vps4 family AAA+-type ATPase
MSIVIVHGPQGTGKTTHAEALRQHYKCSRIVDGWCEESRAALRQGDLALTNQSPPFDVSGATVVDIETAKHEAGLS